MKFVFSGESKEEMCDSLWHKMPKWPNQSEAR